MSLSCPTGRRDFYPAALPPPNSLCLLDFIHLWSWNWTFTNISGIKILKQQKLWCTRSNDTSIVIVSVKRKGTDRLSLKSFICLSFQTIIYNLKQCFNVDWVLTTRNQPRMRTLFINSSNLRPVFFWWNVQLGPQSLPSFHILIQIQYSKIQPFRCLNNVNGYYQTSGFN